MSAHQRETLGPKFAFVNAVAAVLETQGWALLMQVDGPLTHPFTEGPPLAHVDVYCETQGGRPTLRNSPKK